jgi:hypothetical protein
MMDKPYAYMVIERGTRNTYGANTLEEAYSRQSLKVEFDSRTERVDVYGLIVTDPRD